MSNLRYKQAASQTSQGNKASVSCGIECGKISGKGQQAEVDELLVELVLRTEEKDGWCCVEFGETSGRTEILDILKK